LSEAQKRTPRPSPERRDAKSFPLSPTDGFVLSRIDGTLDESELAASTGLPEAQVQSSLLKLESLGLIVFDTSRASAVVARPPLPPASAVTPVALRTSSGETRGAVARPPPPAQAQPGKAAPSVSAPARSVPAAPPSAPSLTGDERASLLEDVDLEPELRKRVIDAYRDLDRRNYYALLGIEENVDRKAIKRAYYEHAAAFHPDRYFRKKLGSFKVRMEAVFAKLTLAHDTLSDKQTRSEYDAYLSEQRIARAIEENLALGIKQAVQVGETVERSVSEDVRVSSPPPVAAAMLAPQVDVGARRDALARRLLGGSMGRTPSSAAMRVAGPSSPPGSPSPSGSPSAPGSPGPTSGSKATADAVNALRRRYEERVAGAKASEARKFAGQAETALAAGDVVASSNAFRIAANLTPDDEALAQKAQNAKAKADALLSETYTKQARYEETHGQWSEAARSWARVCKVNPNDANAHERAAHAVLKASADLHDGARLAQRACELDPKNPLYRITLANCYATAGLTLNARRELDTAAQLAPHDDNIHAMIKRVGLPA
jgi:curved DNA-binding protein CbpA